MHVSEKKILYIIKYKHGPNTMIRKLQNVEESRTKEYNIIHVHL